MAFENLLPCARRILAEGVSHAHAEFTLRLAVHLRDGNYTEESVVEALQVWNEKANADALSINDVKAAVATAFRRPLGRGCGLDLMSPYCEDTCPYHFTRGGLSNEEQILTQISAAPGDGTYLFGRDKFRYLITGYNRLRGNGRCSLTLTFDDKLIFRDMIVFARSADRKKFSREAKKKGVQYDSVDDDLNTIDGVIEEILKAVALEATQRTRKKHILTPEEEKSAREFLDDNPHLLLRVQDMAGLLGVVAEMPNVAIIYLTLTSRLLPTPISVIVKGESSTGKSFVTEQVIKMIPESEIKEFTRATSASLYHGQPDEFKHKVIYFAEAAGADDDQVNLAVRCLQSEGKITLKMAVKDNESGEWSTSEKTVWGPSSIVSTTTQAQLFADNETRCFSIYSDDSKEQTSRILERLGRVAAGELAKPPGDDDLKIFRDAQVLLAEHKGIGVVIPFASEIMASMPTSPARIRRDAVRFITLIQASALTHYYHRKKDDKGRLIANVADYVIAREIGQAVLFQSIEEIGPQAKLIYDWVVEAVKTARLGSIPNFDYGKFDEILYDDCLFTYNDIGRGVGMAKKQVQRWAKQLYAQECLFNINYRRKGFEAKVTVGQRSKSVDSYLPPPKEILAKYGCDQALIYSPTCNGLEV